MTATDCNQTWKKHLLVPEAQFWDPFWFLNQRKRCGEMYKFLDVQFFLQSVIKYLYIQYSSQYHHKKLSLMCCEGKYCMDKFAIYSCLLCVKFLTLVYPLMIDFSDSYSYHSCSFSCCSCSDRREIKSNPNLSLTQQYVFLSKHHSA